MTDLMAKVEAKYSKKDIPDIEPGDTVRVRVRILEGGDQQSARIHSFEGTVIACKGGGINRSITVRRVTYGIGVERSFPLHSPTVADVEIVRRGRVRRSKLYYLRKRHQRAARLKERREVIVKDTAVADSEEAATASEAEAIASEPEDNEELKAETNEEPESDAAEESRDEDAESSEVAEESSEDADA